MKAKIIIASFFFITLFVVFLFSYEWEADIFAESVGTHPQDKVDMKIIIDDQVVFDGTLQKNLAGFPTYIPWSLRIGYHTIIVSSNQEDIYLKEKFLFLFNNHLLLFYCFNKQDDKPGFVFEKGHGEYGFR